MNISHQFYGWLLKAFYDTEPGYRELYVEEKRNRESLQRDYDESEKENAILANRIEDLQDRIDRAQTVLYGDVVVTKESDKGVQRASFATV